MKTSLEIINKIESKKVELGMNVELANIQQLVQEINNAEKLLAQFNSLYEKINALKPQIIKFFTGFCDFIQLARIKAPPSLCAPSIQISLNGFFKILFKLLSIFSSRLCHLTLETA